MPVVHRQNGYTLFFFSNEGTPPEPPHVHVRKGAARAKVWLQPDVRIADQRGFSPAQQSAIWRLVIEHRSMLERKWNDHLGNLGRL